jgi:hypothetical protein
MLPSQSAVSFLPAPGVVETFAQTAPAFSYAQPAPAVVETFAQTAVGSVIHAQPVVSYAQQFEQVGYTSAAVAPVEAVVTAPAVFTSPAVETMLTARQQPAVETIMSARQPAVPQAYAAPAAAYPAQAYAAPAAAVAPGKSANVLSSPFGIGARVEYLARSNGVWYPGKIEGADGAGYSVRLDVGEVKTVAAFEAPSRLRLA